MAQTKKVRGVATSIWSRGETTTVRYHDTNVVTFDARNVWLDSGGWTTSTTKLRMNQASNQFNLGYSVFQRKHKWFVGFLADGAEREFRDGMQIPRTPLVWTGERWMAQE